jgi:hypothetical protein
VHRVARPVDVASAVDAADLVQTAAGAERETDEALEAQVERLQQLRLLVECQNPRARLVPPALDAAERIAEVVAVLDRALEDGLQQPAFAADGALGDRTSGVAAFSGASPRTAFVCIT